jgi:hypothetical protein
MKTYGGSGCIDPRILDLDTSWRRVSASHPGHCTPGTLWTGAWVGLRTALDDVKKRKILPLPGLELRPLGHPACRYTDCPSKLINILPRIVKS